jgi:diadenosine tetraphosphate (Ap4A) HIT family hydrolase
MIKVSKLNNDIEQRGDVEKLSLKFIKNTMTIQTLEQAQKDGVAPWDDLVWQDFHVAVYRDRYPVTRGHLLFVPKENTPGLIREAMTSALWEGNRMVDAGECEGYNVGINAGRVAGQTVMYPHIHLIPRRTGDCADPTGGVRGVIFGQQNYKAAGYQQP